MEDNDLKIQHLISLRNNYFTLFTIISSGIAGLFFVDMQIIKIIFLYMVGIYFDFIFLSKFIYTNNKIKKLVGDI